MTSACLVNYCTSAIEASGINWYVAPTNKNLKTKWEQQLEQSFKDGQLICSKHFSESSFVINRQGLRALKTKAVPLKVTVSDVTPINSVGVPTKPSSLQEHQTRPGLPPKPGTNLTHHVYPVVHGNKKTSKPPLTKPTLISKPKLVLKSEPNPEPHVAAGDTPLVIPLGDNMDDEDEEVAEIESECSDSEEEFSNLVERYSEMQGELSKTQLFPRVVDLEKVTGNFLICYVCGIYCTNATTLRAHVADHPKRKLRKACTICGDLYVGKCSRNH